MPRKSPAKVGAIPFQQLQTRWHRSSLPPHMVATGRQKQKRRRRQGDEGDGIDQARS
jgi:hypothetical protein